MARPNEKLADALKALKKLQNKHSGVIESHDLKEQHRALLVEEGFLRQVMKGWYVCSNPKAGEGDSTIWYASFWPFLSGYLGKRFGKRYCLNVEASILLHTLHGYSPPDYGDDQRGGHLYPQTATRYIGVALR